jgi:hypothetical protein
VPSIKVGEDQEFAQAGYLVGLGTHGQLGDHGAGAPTPPGQQMGLLSSRVPGAAQCFAVEGDHPSAVDDAGVQTHPRTDQFVEPVGASRCRQRRMVDSLGGAPATPSAPSSAGAASATHSAIAVYESAPARVAASATASTPVQAMAHPAGLAWIGYLGQHLQQPGRCRRNVGQLAHQRVGVVDNTQRGR